MHGMRFWKKGTSSGKSAAHSQPASAAEVSLPASAVIEGPQVQALRARTLNKGAGIAGDLQQSCRTGVKQQVIDQPFILQCERSEFPRQGEDDVHVASGQQLSFPRLEPAQAR